MPTVQVVRETFDRAGVVSIASHTPNVGGAWSFVEIVGGAGPSGSMFVGTAGYSYCTGGAAGVVNAASIGSNEWDAFGVFERVSGSLFPMHRFLVGCDAAGAGGIALLIHNYNDELQLRGLSTSFASIGSVLKVVSHTQPNGATKYSVRRRNSGADAVLQVYINDVEVPGLAHTLTGGASAPTTGRFFFQNDGTASTEGRVLEVDVTAEVAAGPVITGPTGAAGAASITHAVNELQANAGTWSATGGSAWSLTGTDAGLLSISSGGVVTLASGNFDRETKASYSFNVLRDAVAQAVTLNINNVNESPTFSGPDISVPGLVVGTPMGSINAALLFADPDSGDTGTYSAVGTWPAGITVSSAGLISGTPSAAGTSSNLRVRRTDGGGLTADSNLFSITVSASSTPVSFSGTVGAQSGTVGSAFSWAGASLASFFSGSLTPFTYNVSAGSLPPGLTLNASTGVVSGTPTTAGSYAATFRALDTGSNAATSNSVAFTIAAAPPPPAGPTLPAVATDATGSAKRLGQTTRMVVEPFTNIESLGTGTRTIATGTTDPTTGEITLTGLAAGTYAVFGFFPSTGATISGVRFRLVTVT